LDCTSPTKLQASGRTALALVPTIACTGPRERTPGWQAARAKWADGVSHLVHCDCQRDGHFASSASRLQLACPASHRLVLHEANGAGPGRALGATICGCESMPVCGMLCMQVQG
jgi:hypothetical protein